jgi:uncharacterized membrane protein
MAIAVEDAGRNMRNARHYRAWRLSINTRSFNMSHLEPSAFGGTMGSAEYKAHYSQAAPTHGEECGTSSSEGQQPAAGLRCGRQNVGNMERVLSVAAGLGLAASGLKRGRVSGLLMTAMGAGLAWRGLSGRCQCYAALGINTAEHSPHTAVPAGQGFKLERRIVVNRSPEELYEFWRRLENLPQVMRHLKYVEANDDQRSHWKAEGAFGTDVEWDAEIINDRQNELIAWRSLPGGDVETAGSVRFRPRHQGTVTEVTLSMKYNPPAGKIGAQIASLFGEGLEEKLDEDLDRFKEVMETGLPAAPELATTGTTTLGRPTSPSQFT